MPNLIESDLKKLAENAKALKETIDNVSSMLADAGRSAVIEVINATSRPLTRLYLDQSGHDSGGFLTLPKTVIAPFSSDVVSSKSGSVIPEGTEGNLFYFLDDAGTKVHVRWHVALLAANEWGINIIGPNADHYLGSGAGAAGNKKVPFQFTIVERADLGKAYDGWQTCAGCKQLISRFDEGKCSADGTPLDVLAVGNLTTFGGMGPINPSTGLQELGGVSGLGGGGGGGPVQPQVMQPSYGPHRPEGTEFAVYFDVEGPNRETGWRKCANCSAMFYDGEARKGDCPGRQGGHIAASDSANYVLTHDRTPRAGQQNDWRFCEKCFTLFFEPQNGDSSCAAGGKHNPYTSAGNPWNYVLTSAPP